MDADQEGVLKALRRALVTSKEYALGPEAWARWVDKVRLGLGLGVRDSG